jgi:hypothetical protein
LSSADESPAALIGNIAQFLDIDMDQRARMRMLVTAYWLTSDPIDMREPVEPTPHQHLVHCGRRQPDLCGDRDRA